MKNKLGDFITIKHGFAFKGDYISTVDNGIVLVTPGNFMIGGGFKESKCKFFSSDYPPDYVLHAGDLIVTMTDLSKDIDTLGYSALVPSSNRVYLHNQRIGLVEIVSDSICKDYLYWLMRSPDYQKAIASTSSGTTVHHTSPARIYDYEIELPSVTIQKQIVAVLSALDDKIELNNKINENLEQQAQAIFKSWFVDFEPFGGVMPDDWRMGTVSEIIELHDYKRVPLSGAERDKMEKIYPYYGATSKMDYVDNYLFDGVYLLLGEDGTVIDGEGFPILQYVYGKFWVNNHAHIITGKLGYSVETLYLLFSLTNIKHIVTGAVQQKVSQANLKKIPVIIPDCDILKDFDNVIQPLFALIRNNRDEIERLSALRDTLLPKLMNGEIDVSEVKI